MGSDASPCDFGCIRRSIIEARLCLAAGLFLVSCTVNPDERRQTVVVQSSEQTSVIPPSSHGSAQDHLERGIALGSRGNLDDAIEELQTAARLAPENVDALVNLGLAYEKKDEWALATASYERALQLQPKHAGAHMGLGVIRHRTGELSKAIAEYRTALRLDPASVNAHYNLGLALHASGDRQGAIAE